MNAEAASNGVFHLQDVQRCRAYDRSFLFSLIGDQNCINLPHKCTVRQVPTLARFIKRLGSCLALYLAHLIPVSKHERTGVQRGPRMAKSRSRLHLQASAANILHIHVWCQAYAESHHIFGPVSSSVWCVRHQSLGRCC